jgi:hypothetical protein
MNVDYQAYPFKVTFSGYVKHLDRWFDNVEFHRSEADYKLRACALNWQIKKVERTTPCSFRSA